MKKLEKAKYENEFYVVLDDKTDYLNFVSRTSTKEQRKKFMIGNIFINAAVCKKCGDYIRSKNLHDYVGCRCFSVFVDGGSHYCKRSGNEEDYIDVIELFYDVKKEVEIERKQIENKKILNCIVNFFKLIKTRYK